MLIAACSSEERPEAQNGIDLLDTAQERAASAQTPDDEFDFPVGPAVLVRAGYEPPADRVAATGGYLPVNGKPTLVFAESIT